MIDIVQQLVIPEAEAKDFNILNINFNILGLKTRDLKAKAVELFQLIAPEKVGKDTVAAFVHEVAKGYKINPYHSFSHGFSVC